MTPWEQRERERHISTIWTLIVVVGGLLLAAYWMQAR
jgi:hypothetical protein